MKIKLNSVIIGAILGMIIPIIVLFIYYKINFSYLRFDNFVFNMVFQQVIVPLVSLCVVANLGVFYLFINKEYYYGARGVIFSTLLYAIVIFIVKLSS